MEHLSSEPSTWTQRAWFTGGCATITITLIKSILLTARAGPWQQLILTAVTAYLAADFGTGIYHWAVDNYGSSNTPIFGPQIEKFQLHHRHPAMTAVQFPKNLYLPAAATAVIGFPIAILSRNPLVLAFTGVLSGFGVFSQQFHAWAHTPRRKLPRVVVALQDAGILLGMAEHAKHHRPPNVGNYCIVSGIWNGILDGSKFFRGLEVIVLHVFGVKPRSWAGLG